MAFSFAFRSGTPLPLALPQTLIRVKFGPFCSPEAEDLGKTFGRRSEGAKNEAFPKPWPAAPA
jgi:hypothetical protein